MSEMLRIYSKGFLKNVTIEELTPWSLLGLPHFLGRFFEPSLIPET
jgi:hypothetical protein